MSGADPKAESWRWRSEAIEWLGSMFPEAAWRPQAPDEEVRAKLADGAVLCAVLRRLCPNSSEEERVGDGGGGGAVRRFLAAVEQMGLPSFGISDLEKGPMSAVFVCLLALRDRFWPRVGDDRNPSVLTRCKTEGSGRWKLPENSRIESAEFSKKENGQGGQTVLKSPVMSEQSPPLARLEPPTSLSRHAGHKFHEVFQMKQGGYSDLPAAKFSEMMKSTSLDVINAPTQSLLSVVTGILDESIERKSGEIPYRVACLLRKVIQEIERRISTQAEHIRNQNNLMKAREEKYQSRIKVLEALAGGTGGQTQAATDNVQQIKMDKEKVEDKRQLAEADMGRLMNEKEDMARLMKEKEDMLRSLKEKEDIIRLMKEKEEMIRLMKEKDEMVNLKKEEDIIRLTKEKEEMVRLMKEKEDMVSSKKQEDIIRLTKEKEEMVSVMKEKEEAVRLMKQKIEDRSQLEEKDMVRSTKKDEDVTRLIKEKEDSSLTVMKLKQELEAVRSSYEESCKLLESKEEDSNFTVMKLKQELEVVRSSYEESCKLLESKKEDNNLTVMKLKKELEAVRSSYEESCKLLESKKEDSNFTVMKLKKELETVRSSYEESCKLLESKKEDLSRLLKDKENSESLVSELRQELEATKRSHETHSQQLQARALQTTKELESRIKEVEAMLEDSRRKTKELQEFSESRFQIWNQKEVIVNQFIGLQIRNVQDLRLSSVSVRDEILNCQKRWSEELTGLGKSLKVLTNAAENYHAALAENRKLFNEIQELKGNIRVYCRIRPFLPGEDQKSTSVEYIGDNGELLLANPSKQGKEGNKMFQFNKVFGPVATQDEVFKDIQPLIRSVLDGYNVCIFAYGQTGSGKTYTMTGPENATEKEWGVNYRALNDLFHISCSRGDTLMYEIGVQMVEIYNEQIRDLLGTGGPQKKLGIWNSAQPNGLALPDATMHPVNSTSQVIELMQTGHDNRAMGATALNVRSSRSHSVVTIHVRGLDLKTGANLRGSLHLVDLAGSERVDRSAVTGDRLKEAQHINKSLSALGDVIFALSQKNAHVPYRNSKLTQVLQSSLGGHAKTLMFVQVNPDVTSYSESLSTLKFAERVSGVELGVARTNKEGKDVKELMEQLSLLKDTIAKKDEEIDRLQLLKTHTPRLKTVIKQADSLLKHSSSSPGISSLGSAIHQARMSSSGRAMSASSRAGSDADFSDTSDRQSEAGSMQSVDDSRHQREIMGLSKLSAGEAGQSSADPELSGFGDVDSEGRLSDISDSGLSMGTETDGSSSVVELTMFPEQEKTPTVPKETPIFQKETPTVPKERLPKVATRTQKPSAPKAGQTSSLRPKPRDAAPRSPMSSGARRSTTSSATSSPATGSTSKRWA